jgi:hypothetical protein
MIVAVMCLLVAGCGGGSDEQGSAVPCDDVAFRAQDEELYVTRATVSNAVGGAGEPAVLLLDLRRARRALAGYLDAHPPCDPALVAVATTERDAISSLDEAIAALDGGDDAQAELESALEALTSAQSALNSCS